MKIIVDAFGGDHAPEEILLGCAQAMEELGVEILLSGDQKRLESAAAKMKGRAPESNARPGAP